MDFVSFQHITTSCSAVKKLAENTKRSVYRIKFSLAQLIHQYF
ncbi:unnamed protein product [Nezara viridula]|uniref:Uncharacterized protein n=1 Tax=Nezara viridula TaxID=85310 RepID=A0A9P0E9R0_NEZVI|nr:unnamed protein product [Nezara viridula]